MSAAKQIRSAGHVTFEGDGDFDDVDWHCNDERIEIPESGGGSDLARILIRINVDGQFDCVYANVGTEVDIAVLDRAIGRLRLIREGLLDIYSRPADGECLRESLNGRCVLEWTHGGDHTFPSATRGGR